MVEAEPRMSRPQPRQKLTHALLGATHHAVKIFGCTLKAHPQQRNHYTDIEAS